MKGRNYVFCIHPLLSTDNFSSIFPLLFFTPRWPQPFLPSLPCSHESEWDNGNSVSSLQLPQFNCCLSPVFFFRVARWISLLSTLTSFMGVQRCLMTQNLLVCSSSFRLISGFPSLLAPRYPPRCSLFSHQISSMALCSLTTGTLMFSTNTSIMKPPSPLNLKQIKMHLQQHSGSQRGDNQ